MKLLSLTAAAALLVAAPVKAGQWMRVIDPPSNVRAIPNGEILCSLTSQRQIYTTSYSSGWYYAPNACSGPGWIHHSQVAPSYSTPAVSGYCILRGQVVADYLCY